MQDQKEREEEAIVEARMLKGQPTHQMALDGMLAQQLASMERTKQNAVPSRRRTRAYGPANNATQTPQQLQNCTSDRPDMARTWQVVGAHVQCLFSDAAHRKDR